jgi:hypothetical protein
LTTGNEELAHMHRAYVEAIQKISGQPPSIK